MPGPSNALLLDITPALVRHVLHHGRLPVDAPLAAALPLRKDPCDVPICEHCTTSPVADKDLCPRHAREFERWKIRRAKDV